MKISRRQLRTIINEAIRKPIFSKVKPEEIDAIRQASREKLDIEDIIGPEKAEKLRIKAQDPYYKDDVLHVYKTFGSDEPDILSAKEEEFYQAQDAHDKKITDDNYQEISEMLLKGGADTLNAIAMIKELGMFKRSPVGMLDYYPDMVPEKILIVGNLTQEATNDFVPVLVKAMRADSTTRKIRFNQGLAAVRGYAGGYFESDKPVLPGEPYGGIAIYLDHTYANFAALRITIRGGKQLKEINKFIKSIY